MPSTPRLAVDLQTVQGGFFGNRGIRRYALGFTGALARRSAVRAMLFNPGRPWLEALPEPLRVRGRLGWSTTAQFRELDDGDTDAYVITSPFERVHPGQSVPPPYVVESGLPVVSLLYDLIPEIVDVYPPELMAAYWERRPLLTQVDLVITLSEHVRMHAIERLGVAPERVSVVGAGASDFFRPPTPGEQPRELVARHLPQLRRPFVLSVTGWSAHKNAEGLIDAWARLPADVRRSHQLVLSCVLPPEACSAWPDRARSLGLAADDVVVTDFVDEAVLRALYQTARLFVLPSLEEGFGLPVLEAVRCGCPAITSNVSSLPEVLELPAATFPPQDLDAMAGLVQRGLLDDAYREELGRAAAAAADHHTWERVAERAIGACAAGPAPRRSRRTPRARIALVAPRPPSAAAAATERIIGRLREQCHVDRFAAPSGAGNGARPAGGSYPATAFGQVLDPWGYDLVVYAVDADPPGELLDLTVRHPGAVWLVDRPDPACIAGLARAARAVVVPEEIGRMAVDAGPFRRPVPIILVPGRDGDAEAGALVTLAHSLATGERSVA